jgi:hypothetical protein
VAPIVFLAGLLAFHSWSLRVRVSWLTRPLRFVSAHELFDPLLSRW